MFYCFLFALTGHFSGCESNLWYRNRPTILCKQEIFRKWPQKCNWCIFIFNFNLVIVQFMHFISLIAFFVVGMLLILTHNIRLILHPIILLINGFHNVTCYFSYFSYILLDFWSRSPSKMMSWISCSNDWYSLWIKSRKIISLIPQIWMN